MSVPHRLVGDPGHILRLVKSRGAGLLHAVVAVVREIKQGGLDYRAMSLVYTSLLALIPLLAVSFSIMKAFGAESQLEPVLLELLDPLGDNADAVANRILDSVKRLRVGLLGFLGFAFLFYTSVALLEKIEESFNHIWRTKASRSLLRRFSDYLSFTLVGPLLVFSAFGGMSGLIESRPHTRSFKGLFEPLQPAFHLLLPYVFVIAAFTFLYRYVPNTRVKTRAALFGGMAAGLAWKGAGWAFSGFVASSSQYHAVYSSFAILVLFMIWLYVSWLIVLLGVQVSFYYQHPRYFRFKTGHVRLGPRAFERVGLMVAWQVAHRFYCGDPAGNTESLAESLDLPEDCIDELLHVLQDAGVVMAVDADARSFVPAKDLSAISLRELLQALRAAHEDDFSLDSATIHAEAIGNFGTGLEAAISEYAGTRTLRDLVAQPEPKKIGEPMEAT
ncbi:MAG: putative ribonuclease [Proteobacteria bacterium]|nr:putative ribonuclease [Pseudomonadota bacterium]